ncbi:MAG: family 1 glycosylhydrolase [Acidimicrobiia bacterium]
MAWPHHVLAGTVTSSVGAEGAAPASDWYSWEVSGRVPRSEEGNGARGRYAEDFVAMAEHGIRAHRLTLEWARLEPRPGRHDLAAVEHYRDVLRAARAVGVEPWACLHHLSLPGWFSQDERGFLDEKMARLVWPAHVDWVAESFGDLVRGWVPVQEPLTYALAAYGEGLIPPGRRDEDDFYTGRAALLRATLEAAAVLRGTAPVVSAHGSALLPSGDELRAEAEVFDAIGITHAAVDDGTLRVALRSVTERLEDDGVALVVAACGVGTDEEDERADRLRSSLDQVAEAVSLDGLDVRSFWWRTAIDGYEWHEGFAPHWGLFDRDRNPRLATEMWPDR